MTIQEINPSKTQEGAILEDNSLVLENFTEPDPVVVRVLSDAPDLLIGVHTCLQVGARALLAGHGALDEVLVGRSFEQLRERMESTVNSGAGLIIETAHALCGPDDGQLPALMAEARAEFETTVGAMFDPESKTSLLALFEQVMSTTITRHEAARWAQLDPDDEHSALGRWRAAQSKELKTSLDEILTEVRTLAVDRAVADGQAEVFGLTTLKGIAYQDAVHLAFTGAAAAHSDVVDDVGRQRGSTGSMVGDLVVAFNSEEFSGASPVLAIEVKSKRMPLRKMLEELGLAMANRDAGAGLAVFSSREIAPIPSVFANYGDKAILVLDEEAPDLAAVELALEWARWTLRRAASSTPHAFDQAAFADSVAKVTRALERVSTIRRCHSTIKRQVDQGGSELDDLVAEIRVAITELKEIAASASVD